MQSGDSGKMLSFRFLPNHSADCHRDKFRRLCYELDTGNMLQMLMLYVGAFAVFCGDRRFFLTHHFEFLQ